MGSRIDDLPVELLTLTFGYLGLDDQRKLRRVNKRFSIVLIPFLFRTVHIKASKRSRDSETKELVACRKLVEYARSPIAHMIKSLSLSVRAETISSIQTNQEDWNAVSALLQQIELLDFALAGAGERPTPRELAALKDANAVVQAAKHIKSLYIWFPLTEEYLAFDPVLGGVAFPQLETLHIGYASVTEASLVELVTRHASTLKRLELRSILFDGIAKQRYRTYLTRKQEGCDLDMCSVIVDHNLDHGESVFLVLDMSRAFQNSNGQTKEVFSNTIPWNHDFTIVWQRLPQGNPQ